MKADKSWSRPQLIPKAASAVQLEENIVAVRSQPKLDVFLPMESGSGKCSSSSTSLQIDGKVFEEIPTKTSTAVVVTQVVNPDELGGALLVPVDAISVHHSMSPVAAVTSQKCTVMAERLGANQMLDRMLAMSDDKEQVQVKDELPGALEVFDGTPERIRSGTKLHRLVKWVSRVCIVHHPMRMAPRSKFCNCATMPSPPPVPPLRPAQPVHHLDPCPPPQTPMLPHPPDPL
jgi:hypothetical protein